MGFIKPFQNAQYFIPKEVDGRWEIPTANRLPADNFRKDTEFIGFNYMLTDQHPYGKGVHFYVDDYQFERVWQRPTVYLDRLRQYRYVIAPDFSIYIDLPVSLALHSHYKKHWCEAFWQELGITVIPMIRWGEPKTYEFCFDGEPRNSVVSVSSVGFGYTPGDREIFNVGFQEMVWRLQPELILFYGMDFLPADFNREKIIFKKHGMAERFDKGHADGTISKQRKRKKP